VSSPFLNGARLMPVLSPAYEFRLAAAADTDGLARLAAADGARALRGRVLVVAEGERFVAAYSMDECRAVADPAHVVAVADALASEAPAAMTPVAARLILRHRLAALAGQRGPQTAPAPRGAHAPPAAALSARRRAPGGEGGEDAGRLGGLIEGDRRRRPAAGARRGAARDRAASRGPRSPTRRARTVEGGQALGRREDEPAVGRSRGACGPRRGGSRAARGGGAPPPRRRPGRTA